MLINFVSKIQDRQCLPDEDILLLKNEDLEMWECQLSLSLFRCVFIFPSKIEFDDFLNVFGMSYDVRLFLVCSWPPQQRKI